MRLHSASALSVHRESGAFIGRGGLLSWTIDGKQEIETAYLIAKPFWRQGLGQRIPDGARASRLC